MAEVMCLAPKLRNDLGFYYFGIEITPLPRREFLENVKEGIHSPSFIYIAISFTFENFYLGGEERRGEGEGFSVQHNPYSAI